MKQPLLTGRHTSSSYFSSIQNSSLRNDSHQVSQNPPDKLRFPNSRVDLWNTMPCGDPVIFGIEHYHPITLLCLERCLRLAHRHASQSLSEENENIKQFTGFLMGTTTHTEDESSIVINLDRFDPGTIRSDGNKTPSTPLPGDVVIPVIFTESFPQSIDSSSVFSIHDYQNAFKLLHHQVSTRLSVENTSLFPIRLHCYYTKDSQHDEIEMLLQWVTPCISNSFHSSPIKPVPIIPTALAKNLAGPLNLSSIQHSSKTGYLSMNQSRKLLLLLDSDPKSRSIPTIGIWVSGVISVHNPMVWLACMRYLFCADIYERTMSDGYFLLVLYSVTSSTPLFFQVKFDENNKINFDLLHVQKCIQVHKQSGSSEKVLEFRLQSTSGDLPEGAFKERELFLEAQKNVETFPAPNKEEIPDETASSDEEEKEQHIRGRQPRKGSSIPQSILRNNSGNRRQSSGSRNRNLTNGVSFSLAVDDTEVFHDAMPLPLPSPHPSTIHQSPNLVKPSVPELSIIFDENYQAPMQHSRQPSRSPTKRKIPSEKGHSNSPGIRSPLKNINNLNSVNRGISPQDRRPPGPLKPPGNHYRHSMAGTKTSTGFSHDRPPQFLPSHAPMQRRSRSASDCIRGTNRNVTQTHAPQIGPPSRPIMSYQALYSATPMQVQGPGLHPSAAPVGQFTPHPYPNHPRFQYSNNMGPTPNIAPHLHPHVYPDIQYRPHATVPSTYPVNNTQIMSKPPLYASQAPQMTPMPQYREPTNLLTTPSMSSDPQISPPLPTPYTAPMKPQIAPTLQSQTIHGLQKQQEVYPHATQASIPNNGLPAESPVWMKQLPPEAYQLLMHQDAQLKQLQAQIQKLLAMQETGNSSKQEKPVMSTAETSTSTEAESQAESNKVSMGVNTGQSLYIPSESTVDVQTFVEDESQAKAQPTSNETTPFSSITTSSNQPLCQNEKLTDEVQTENDSKQRQEEENKDMHAATINRINALRCESQCTDKYPASEFASIHLDETNLREIASANNEEDCDTRSLASSLRAVDLPLLETSTEQSSFNTPTSKVAGGIWSAQDSPVLGESASMCVVPPINLNQSLQEEEEREEEPKDENFMKNLLSQVRDMLKKADIDSKSEMSSENSAASTPQRSVKKSKKIKQSREDKVAKATRKQLRKMGVQLDNEAVNALSFAVAANDKKKSSGEEYPFTLPEPLIPRLNYLSVMAGGSSSNTLFPGPSSTDLSMHANAIALKYLSNDQLEEIAASSKFGKNSSTVFSPLKSKSSSSGERLAIHDMFGANVRKLGEKNIPGMSLVSPCNMSLATRKYMEKYGLIEKDDDDDEESEEEERDIPDEVRRPSTPVNDEKHSTSISASPVLKSIRQNTKSQPYKQQKVMPQNQPETYPEFPPPEPGFSELKMNLGDTLDMILPFLDDLGRHRQQTPSSVTNGRDSRSGTRSSNTGSSRDRLTSISERQHHSQANSPANDKDSTERIISPHSSKQKGGSRPSSRKGDNSHPRSGDPSPKGFFKHDKMRNGRQDNEVSQVLSPKLLQALAEGKKLTQTPGYDDGNYQPPHTHRGSHPREKSPPEDDHDFLAGTWPRHHFRAHSESEFSRQQPDYLRPNNSREQSQEKRRLSSSPLGPGERPITRSTRPTDHRRSRTSPPNLSKLKRIQAIHNQKLEDLQEVEWSRDSREIGGTRQEFSEEEEEEEPVLTSRVTDAFKEKEETKKKNEERSANTPHFLQHLQKQTGKDSNQFLDLDKIRNLPKLV